MTDPIFEAAAYLEKVCVEIDHLGTEIASGLNQSGFRVDLDDGTMVTGDDYADLRYGFSYSVKGAFKNQKLPAQIVLHFDLWRASGSSTWVNARDALLIVAYDAELRNVWGPDGLVVRADGQFEDEETRSGLRAEHEGRLLVWQRSGRPADYSRHAWIYGLKLRDIGSLEDARVKVIAPITAILRSPETAGAVLKASDAVQWPDPVQKEGLLATKGSARSPSSVKNRSGAA